MQWVFSQPPPWEVAWVADGAEALDFLQRKRKHKEAWKPDLIVMSLALPRCKGMEVLMRIKADPTLRSIPVVIWSVSSFQEDIDRAYREGAAVYLMKPAFEREVRRQALALRRLFEWARLPSQGPHP
jgi:CheY-like chemotaxis protein